MNERHAIDAVLLHPPVAAMFACVEHAVGDLQSLGDALGVDCTVVRVVDGWPRAHSSDGRRNTDWYGWNEPLLSPSDATIEEIRANETVNLPGEVGRPPAAAISFLRDDGIHIVYAHVQAVTVEPGDRVAAGAPVARIGNNGVARNPHVHVGAWRGDTPLQVRFDLEALGTLRRRQPG